MQLRLKPDDLDALMRPVRGRGGFQSLLRRIQRCVIGNELTLPSELVERIRRYVKKYGRGGFQYRLAPLLDELDKR